MLNCRHSPSLLVRVIYTTNKNINDNLVKKDLELQLQNMSYEKVVDELELIKKENNELKEEILFYEKIVGKRKK